MIDKTDFETFLYVSMNKYQIFVFDNKKPEKLYNEELKINNEFDIKNLYFFSSKRWDFELKDNTIIKLPNENTKLALKLALEFLHNNEFKDNRIIDARIKNQIILND